MKKIIVVFLMQVCIFISSFSMSVQTDYAYFNEDVISNITTRINFTLVGVRISGNNIDKDSYFELEGNSGLNGNFLLGENLIITSAENNMRGNRVYFRNKKGEFNSEIKIDIKGTLLLNWRSQDRRVNLVIGKVYDRLGNWEKVSVELQQINIIKPLEIKVEDHMYLGRAIAGEKMDTEKTSDAHPAKLTFMGELGENIKIVIPQEVKIMNNLGDSLNVRLGFRDNKSTQITKKFIKKENNQGVIRDFYIDGIAETNSNNFGEYKGEFIVRVEYEN